VKKDEISSTEKLLEQIREDRSDASSTSPLPPENLGTVSLGFQHRLRSALKFTNPVRIGVDIGYADVRLIKTIQSGVNRHQIVAYRHVPFDPGMDPQNLLFPQFLRNTLADFGGSEDDARIWTTISSARLDTRLLRIPKVARRQIPNAVLWAYKKKSPYDDKKHLFDFEILGETTENEKPQFEVFAYTVPREDIDAVTAAFTRAGYPLEGVSTYPFLMQNLLRSRWKILGQGNLCALYIGRNWSRIDMFSNGNLMLSRGIRAGMNSMLEEIKADGRFADQTPPDAPLEMDFRPAAALSDAPQDVSGIMPVRVLAKLAPEVAPGHDRTPPPHQPEDIEPEEIFAIIRPALDRLIRQVERTVGHYAINFEQRDIDRLCVSGMTSDSEHIRNYLAEQLETPLVDLNPFDNEALADPPDTPQEQLAYIPAAGLASSTSGLTPNFLQTFHDRSRREKRQLFNSILFGLFLLAMIGCLVYNGMQKHNLLVRHRHMTQLQEQLAGFSPLLNPETVLVLGAKAKEATTRLTRYGKKYRGMAVIAELSRLTPADIAMTDMAIRLPRRTVNGEDPPPRRVLSIAGVIQGQRLKLESTLAAYLVQMKASPLFTGPRIIEKSFEMLGGQEVLRFRAELEVL